MRKILTKTKFQFLLAMSFLFSLLLFPFYLYFSKSFLIREEFYFLGVLLIISIIFFFKLKAYDKVKSTAYHRYVFSIIFSIVFFIFFGNNIKDAIIFDIQNKAESIAHELDSYISKNGQIPKTIEMLNTNTYYFINIIPQTFKYEVDSNFYYISFNGFEGYRFVYSNRNKKWIVYD